ncbi:MAG: PspC domain-containing protein, partial [Chloroflexi bacterium]|nr:PspC domain-containing protein [Chloroflexota bacterium]
MNTLRRSRTDRVIGGVCGGLAEYLALDPLLVRIFFIVFGIMTGMGVVAYMLLWLLVPAEDATFATRDEMIRHN